MKTHRLFPGDDRLQHRTKRGLLSFLGNPGKMEPL